MSIKFEVKTIAGNLSLGLFIADDAEVTLKGVRHWRWGEWEYELTGWEIVHPENPDDVLSGSPEMLALIFDDVLSATRAEMIELHEAEQDAALAEFDKDNYYLTKTKTVR